MHTRTLPAAWRFRLDRHDDPEPAPAPSGDPAADPAADDAPLGPPGQKALDEFKRRAREAEGKVKAAEDRIREFEDRDKTELEKAQQAAARAIADADQARAELLRQRIVNEIGLPADLAEFLPDGDEDTVRAAAAKLAAATAPADPADRRPRPDPSQGSGRPVVPVDYRTADKDVVRARLTELGVRSYR